MEIFRARTQQCWRGLRWVFYLRKLSKSSLVRGKFISAITMSGIDKVVVQIQQVYTLQTFLLHVTETFITTSLCRKKKYFCTFFTNETPTYSEKFFWKKKSTISELDGMKAADSGSSSDCLPHFNKGQVIVDTTNKKRGKKHTEASTVLYWRTLALSLLLVSANSSPHLVLQPKTRASTSGVASFDPLH